MYSMYDQAFNNFFHSKIESIQYNACLAITGAIQGTSRGKTYQELGLEFPQLRRWYRKLCLFSFMYEVQHMLQELWATFPLLRQSITFSKIIFFHLLLLNGIT